MKKSIVIFAITLLVVMQCYSLIAGKLDAKEIDFHNFPKTNDTQVEYSRPKPVTQKPVTPKQVNSNKNNNTQKATSTSTTSSVSVSQLDAIAQRALNAAENRDQAGLNQCAKEFMDAGVNRVYPPQVVAKKTPQCPPIKMELNGTTLSGSKCVKMGYIYKGKTYWKGYCR